MIRLVLFLAAAPFCFALFLAAAPFCSTAYGQIASVSSGGRCGTASCIDGQWISVGHVVYGVPLSQDSTVVIGECIGIECFPPGEPEIGPATVYGVVRGQPIRQSVHVDHIGAIVRWSPAPRLGMSGGPVVQGGRAVAVVRSRCGPFGYGFRAKSKVRSR